jgi:3'(2'), 5'-bisphosphate nucleotidase
MKFSPERLTALLPEVIRIARAAGEAILKIYGDDFAVELKSDQSPLTAADLAAQHLISAELAKLTPDVPMLGEESASEAIAERRSWPTLWLVDPLDGTREFVQRNGDFTVNIALIHDHEPRLGVVYAPAIDALYAGIPGQGAWRAGPDGTLTPIHAARTSAAVPRILVSRSHRGSSLDAMLERLGNHELVPVGSALKFGLLAEGRGDLYPRLSPTSEWDTAAGQAVAVAAGARVETPQGATLRYNSRDGLLNPSFLAYADPDRDWRSLCPAARPHSDA